MNEIDEIRAIQARKIQWIRDNLTSDGQLSPEILSAICFADQARMRQRGYPRLARDVVLEGARLLDYLQAS